MNAPPVRDYVRLKDAATSTGLDYQLLYGLVRSGAIPGYDLGTPKRASWWVKTADIAEYVESRRAS